MVIHFICRGNAYRSIIAEAYLNSLNEKDVKIISSGTVAACYRASNVNNYKDTLSLLKEHGIAQFAKKEYGEQLPAGEPVKGDIIVLFNHIVRREAEQIVDLPNNVRVWNVVDVGEPGRTPKDKAEEREINEEVFREITHLVDQLVSELKLQPKST